MPEFLFKEFTEEESKIYEDALAKYRESIDAGKTLRQAFESFTIVDKELQAMIQVDFLKILIAERHFSLQQPLEELAKSLDISLDLVKDTRKRMLQEAGVSAANEFGKEYGDIINPTND
jgi:type II secretory pathway component PulF